MNSKILITAVIGIVVIGGGFVLFQQSSSTPGNVSEDSGSKVIANGKNGGNERMVPDLSFEDYDGNTVSLRGFKGTPIVVNSWAVWCPFCLEELPAFAEVVNEFEGDVVVIAVDRAEPLSLAKEFSDKLGVTDDLLFVLDPSDSFYKAIGGFSMPETIFVDKEGVIQEHKRGPMDADEFRRRLQSIL